MLAQAKAIRREPSMAERIPYTAHVDPFVVRTARGDYVQTIRLAGASFESADDERLNNWHERLNVLWRNLASPQLALWVHVIRRRHTHFPLSGEGTGFAAALTLRYRDKLARETLMVNELYLSLVHQPQATAAGATAWRLLARPDTGAAALELRDSLEECTKRRQEALAALDRYDPEPLGIQVREGRSESTLLEFLALLVNGERQPMPLPRAPINEVLATSRPLFGHEAMEYRMPTGTRAAAFLGVKEYPTPSVTGMFDELLTAPFPFVLTQSFAFLAKSTAVDLMSRQHNRLRAAADLAVSQAAEIGDALDDLVSNRFVLGDHHLTLQVQLDVDPAAPPEATSRRLNDHVALARSMLADTGMVVAREDLALEAAFWAQLPGAFALRSRKAPITSRNFAAMAPFHNFPTGRPSGNHWGDAITVFMTTARSPFFFSMHASDDRAPDGGSRRDVGHLTAIGPVGTGKTTVLGFLVCMTARTGATQVVFDKDEGLHILLRALGGRYLPLKNGLCTGCNPLQLWPTASNVEFLKRWLRRLVQRHPGEQLTVLQDQAIDQALHDTLALDRPARRLSRLLEFLDPTDPEGLHARLTRWCGDGDEAWVFDNPADDIVGLLEGSPLVGFDVTDFIDHPVVRDPLTMYLFHLVNGLADGRRLAVWADEFAKLLADPSFAAFAKNGLETWRKRNALLASFTQSAHHVLGSPIARAIVEQTPTKLFFPNPDADPDEYREGFSLTEREVRLIKQELEPGSRCFLLKQNHVSVVVQLDLAGFDFELDVISGRTANVALMHQAIASAGTDPKAWLPSFKQALAHRNHPKEERHAA